MLLPDQPDYLAEFHKGVGTSYYHKKLYHHESTKTVRSRKSVEIKRRYPLDRAFIVGHQISGSVFRAIGSAWKFIIRAYNLSPGDPRLNFTIILNETAPVSEDSDSVVLGSWDGVAIRLYVDNIPSTSNKESWIFAIVVHEILHALAFNYDSFVPNVDPETNEYINPNNQQCVENVHGWTDIVYAGPNLVHWKPNTDPFNKDIMGPIIHILSISYCTLRLVVDAYPGWTLLACTNSSSCLEENATCTLFGEHVGSFCSVPQEQVLLGKGTQPTQFPDFTMFLFGLFALLYALAQCNMRHPKSRAAIRTKKYMKQW
jgi:hypothetical protein